MVTFGGDCLVARRGFGCGALGLAGTCSQGSGDSVGSFRSMGGHIKTWYHRAILVRERKPGAGDRQEGALH